MQSEKARLMRVMDEKIQRGTAAKGMRLGIFGDSYVQGTGGRPEDSLAYVLIEELERRGIALSYVEIYAQDGATVRDIALSIQRAYHAANPDEKIEVAPEDKFDLLVVNGGVNDQYQGLRVSGFLDHLHKQLLPTLKKLAKSETAIFKLNTTNWGEAPVCVEGEGTVYRIHPIHGYQRVRDIMQGNADLKIEADPFYNTPMRIQQEIRDFNEAERRYLAGEITAFSCKHAINLIDISTPTSAMVFPQGKPRPDLYAEESDKLHYTREVYQMQATIIADLIQKVT